jgi:ornithine cyclodeaminase/alanine dehydrogenase-like protein (mu-crystallin family)
MALDRTVLYLNRDDIETINLPMARIIELVEYALIEKAHGRAQMPAKHWMEPTPTRWFGAMSCLLQGLGYASCKWQSGSSGNVSKGLPYLTGMLFLNDLEDGLVVAVMDSTWITQQRTAAASAVAVKHLARTDLAAVVGMLGCGVQARSHLTAFRLVLPALREIVAYDIRLEATREYAQAVRATGLNARIVSSPREAVEAADVVVTAGPIEPTGNRTIEPGWLKPGALGVTLDYDCYWKPEAFASVDRLFADDIAQVNHIKEYGYFVGAPEPDGELGAVAAGLIVGRRSPTDSIVTMNMGVAVEDVVTAKEIYERARNQARGIKLPM